MTDPTPRSGRLLDLTIGRSHIADAECYYLRVEGNGDIPEGTIVRPFIVGPDNLTDPERELAKARELLQTVWSITLGASCKITDGAPHHAQGMIDAALAEIEEYMHSHPDNASDVAKETRDDG